MNNLEIKARLVSFITSIVTVATVVSQVSAEVLEIVGDWDGQTVNALAALPALWYIIRNVTPSDRKGLI